MAELLGKFVIYDFQENSVLEVEKIYKRLSEKGKMVNELDLIIAGIAVTNNQTPITKDKDFSKLEENRIIILT